MTLRKVVALFTTITICIGIIFHILVGTKIVAVSYWVIYSLVALLVVPYVWAYNLQLHSLRKIHDFNKKAIGQWARQHYMFPHRYAHLTMPTVSRNLVFLQIFWSIGFACAILLFLITLVLVDHTALASSSTMMARIGLPIALGAATYSLPVLLA